MAIQTFELISGNFVFATTQDRTNAKNFITNYLSKPQLAGSEPTMYDVPAGKYGAGPTLNLTVRFADAADADACWADLKARALSFLIHGTIAWRASVVQDNDTGLGNTSVIEQIVL